jgi:hypothetical protein
LCGTIYIYTLCDKECDKECKRRSFQHKLGEHTFS